MFVVYVRQEKVHIREMAIGLSVSVGGRILDSVLVCFKVVFECNSVFVSTGVVPEVMLDIVFGDV